jgi:hypothetical protein
MTPAQGQDITAKEAAMSNLTVLDTSSLDAVTGGSGGSVTERPNPGSSTSSALTSQLAGLQSSIKDLAGAQKPASLFGGNSMLLFAALAMNRPQVAQTNVVYVGRRHWW